MIPLARGLALGGYFALLGLLLAWHAWLAPSQYFPVALTLMVTTLPLLLPLRGLLHGRDRSHVWASYLSLLYVMHGSVEAYVNPAERLYALLEVGFAASLYFGALLYLRALKRQPTELEQP